MVFMECGEPGTQEIILDHGMDSPQPSIQLPESFISLAAEEMITTANTVFFHSKSSIDLRHLGYLNDLWMWNPQMNNWIWIAGSNEADQKGIYGDYRIPAANLTPGSRRGASINYCATLNMLILFGGDGFDQNGVKGDYMFHVYRHQIVILILLLFRLFRRFVGI